MFVTRFDPHERPVTRSWSFLRDAAPADSRLPKTNFRSRGNVLCVEVRASSNRKSAFNE